MLVIHKNFYSGYTFNVVMATVNHKFVGVKKRNFSLTHSHPKLCDECGAEIIRTTSFSPTCTRCGLVWSDDPLYGSPHTIANTLSRKDTHTFTRYTGNLSFPQSGVHVYSSRFKRMAKLQSKINVSAIPKYLEVEKRIAHLCALYDISIDYSLIAFVARKIYPQMKARSKARNPFDLGTVLFILTCRQRNIYISVKQVLKDQTLSVSVFNCILKEILQYAKALFGKTRWTILHECDLVLFYLWDILQFSFAQYQGIKKFYTVLIRSLNQKPAIIVAAALRCFQDRQEPQHSTNKISLVTLSRVLHISSSAIHTCQKKIDGLIKAIPKRSPLPDTSQKSMISQPRSLNSFPSLLVSTLVHVGKSNLLRLNKDLCSIFSNYLVPIIPYLSPVPKYPIAPIYASGFGPPCIIK